LTSFPDFERWRLRGLTPALCIPLFVLAPLFCAFVLGTVSTPASAQNFGGRTATVSVAEASEEVLSVFTDVQGRVAADGSTAITATVNAVTTLEDLKLGDRVKKGQIVATQDAADLRHRLALLEAQRAEAKLRQEEASTAIESEKAIIILLEDQLALLKGRAERANSLVAKNALAPDAAETAQTAVINARQQIAQRRSTLDTRRSQALLAEAALARIDVEIGQVKADIAATKITAPRDGQIVFLLASQRGFSREGDVLMRTRATSDYEVEAEIPLEFLRFVARNETVEATDFTGGAVTLKPRVFLPVQNIRTGTQTVRFSIKGDLPRSLRAENAPVTLKVPTTSPAPVVTVPKDAVIPVSGGHVVFIAENDMALQRRVRLGNAVDASFVVLEGLKAGEMVITRGNEGLVDGRKIKIGDPGERPAGPKGDKWTLTWTTRRGPAEGDLVLGADKSFFNGEPVEVTRAGDDIAFVGKLVLPFGVMELDFTGTITGDAMAGKVTLRGLPSGATPTIDFTGKKAGG